MLASWEDDNGPGDSVECGKEPMVYMILDMVTRMDGWNMLFCSN
jgi:hypothetical protein